MRQSDNPPSVFISGSATGYYGDQDDALVDEDEPPIIDFAHTLCARWEDLARRARSEKTRVCLSRTGVMQENYVIGDMAGKLHLVRHHPMVSPSSASFCMMRSTSPTSSGSSAEVGSSNNSTSGSIASTRAMETRCCCCCPPERLMGYLARARSSIPTLSR